MEQNNRAVLLPRLQIKPHTGPLLRQLLQDGCRISRQTARKNSCPTSRERETVGAAANIWPQARRPSRTGAEGPDRRSGHLQPRRDSRGCFGTKSSRGEKKKKRRLKRFSPLQFGLMFRSRFAIFTQRPLLWPRVYTRQSQVNHISIPINKLLRMANTEICHFVSFISI